MLQINPKKFKEIKNKTIPNPLRPKFRKKAQSNIYFLSQRKVSGEKRDKFVKNIRLSIEDNQFEIYKNNFLKNYNLVLKD